MMFGTAHVELSILDQMVPTVVHLCGLSQKQQEELEELVRKQKERVLARKEKADAVFEAIFKSAEFENGSPERIVADEKVRVLMDKLREGLVVHALYRGLPLCGFTTNTPNKWPVGHMWVGKDETASLTCDACKRKAQE